MPKFFTVLFFAIIVQVSAQTSAPKFINYQGIARDASGTPITSAFDIQFTIKNPTATVHNEFQNGIQPNSLGLFTTVIGKAPNTLTLAAWDNGPFTLDVSINTGSSFTLVGSQQLVSVPFSLFAGNVPSSYTNNILTIGANSYSIGSGSSITTTIVGTGLASVTPTTGSLYSVNVPTPTLGYSTIGNVLTLTQGSAVSTVTLAGSGSSTITMVGQGNAVVTPTFGSAFTVNVPPQVLTNASNTLSLSNGGGSIVVPSLTLSNGPGITINGSWPTQTISASGTTNTPWVKSGNTVTLSAINDNVGIGMALPTAKLDVAGNAATTTSILKITNSNSSNSSPAIIVSSNGGAAINASDNTAAGANAGEFNSNNGNAINAITNSSAKSAIIGENGSITSNSLAIGIYGKTNNPNNLASAVVGDNLGGGAGVTGLNNAPVAAVRGINQYTTTSNGFAYGVYGLSNNSSGPAAGVYGENKGGGIGVYGTNTNSGTINAIGVYGLVANTSGTNAVGVRGDGNGAGPGVQGINFGNGPAIHGLKTNTTTAGNAGRFEINNSSNSADAIFVSTMGAGAAVHAVTNPTLNSSALALLLENGHISTSGTLPSTATVNSLNGGNISLLGTSTDVAGRITITFGTGPFTAGGYAQILYAKPYAVAPVIILTPANGAASSNQVFVTSNLTNFIINYNSSPLTGPHVFNYIIIETK